MTVGIEEIACLTGIAAWKRQRVRAMVAPGVPSIASAKSAVRTALRNRGAVAAWASRIPQGLEALTAEAGLALWTIEDGFIRSVGLGAALVQPCSLLVDRSGIHYDPRRPSDLETLLQSATFGEAELARAEALIARLCAREVTKYNLVGGQPVLPKDRKIALVLGQVDDDLSVQFGGAGQSVAGMLEQVRQDEPDAFIVFKPHPDVVSGLRQGLIDPPVDAVVPEASLTALFERADSVHVLTSLGGFEALLRGCRVVVHGQPFYAGWGLTIDKVRLPRRQRQLSLAELVAGALLRYPLYYHPQARRTCTVEELLDFMEAEARGAMPAGLRRLAGVAARRIGEARRKR